MQSSAYLLLDCSEEIWSSVIHLGEGPQRVRERLPIELMKPAVGFARDGVHQTRRRMPIASKRPRYDREVLRAELGQHRRRVRRERVEKLGHIEADAGESPSNVGDILRIEACHLGKRFDLKLTPEWSPWRSATEANSSNAVSRLRQLMRIKIGEVGDGLNAGLQQGSLSITHPAGTGWVSHFIDQFRGTGIAARMVHQAPNSRPENCQIVCSLAVLCIVNMICSSNFGASSWSN
mmetsp:Transcript_32563/g.71439  ORF Transcript_32563/g.71439 Transcript_32563/m.71439 type:complete len:235 (+) Transcript_32563:1514-2218(+)